MVDTRQLETAIWAAVDGRTSPDEDAALHANKRATVAVFDRLIDETEAALADVRDLKGEERAQVEADFVDTLRDLRSAARPFRDTPPPREPRTTRPETDDETDAAPGEVRLQGSWSDGHVVVWAAGRGATPDDNDGLATRLEKSGGPSIGWLVHRGVPLPGGVRAEALSIPVKDALGWLVALGAAHPPDGRDGRDGRDGHDDGVADSLVWLGRVAIEAVRLVARGSVVPAVRVASPVKDRVAEASVQWVPALSDNAMVAALADVMPRPVVALGRGTGRATAAAVIAAVVEAIVTESVERMELRAPPPAVRTPQDLDDTVIARMDGSPFHGPSAMVIDLSRRLEQWSRPVVGTNRARLVVRLDEPQGGAAWVLSVHVRSAPDRLLSLDAALAADGPGRPVAREWARLLQLAPVLRRPAGQRRGIVALAQDEAWELMTVLGPTLTTVGFEVRVPALSRTKARPSLRLFAEAKAGSVVGAHQLSNVAWSVVIDDIELTAADVNQLARQARPLVQSRGQWIEVDRIDLERAALALAERADTTTLTGAEILRYRIGVDGGGLSGGVRVEGESWANDIIRRAGEVSTAPITSPDNFEGELRTYQAEALAWLGFLDGSGLGGCLALDMGLGKTPTVLAHLIRTAGEEAALVVAPAAVVGNWAAEAARFAPTLRVVVHHGASRASAEELQAEIAGADVVVTTYATAVRDIEALTATTWGTLVLDEAQAIKNPANETSQQLRRITARQRLALTGTPIENGLGDLWAILDFTNPGLVGERAAFIAQMSGDGEAALRALNGILIFRRTKLEPVVAAELPDKIDELDHCTMTPEQIGLYQAVLDDLVKNVADSDSVAETKKGAVLAAITALKQICNHPAAYVDDSRPLAGRSGKLARLEQIVESVFEAGERILIFTHFASWGRRLAEYLTELKGIPIACYDGSLSRTVRDRLVSDFQNGEGAGALVLSLTAGGTGLNLTAANHVVLYDRWWNPAVEDQARDRAWRIGQSRTVISHRLVCPGTVDERVEEVVAGKRHIANLVLPRSSSLADLDTTQLRLALGLRPDEVLAWDDR